MPPFCKLAGGIDMLDVISNPIELVAGQSPFSLSLRVKTLHPEGSLDIPPPGYLISRYSDLIPNRIMLIIL